jgi:hypothetical protein
MGSVVHFSLSLIPLDMYYFCSGSKPPYVLSLFQHLGGVCEQGLCEGPDAGGGGDWHAGHRPVCLHQHRSVPAGRLHGLSNYIDTKAKCGHLKKLTCKGTCGRCLSEYIDWVI